MAELTHFGVVTSLKGPQAFDVLKEATEAFKRQVFFVLFR